MKQTELEAFKFKAESLKQIGFALCTPFSIVLLKILVAESKFFEMLLEIKLYICFVFFIIGFTCINKAFDIMDKVRSF